MRKPEYLSPTSINLYFKNPDDFYIRYLSENRPPRPKQTQPMSIGSAFDAYVKSYLHESLFGKGHDPRYELKTLFDEQVEPHNRDWAWENGKFAFSCYMKSGALTDLLLELKQAIGKPRFEIEVRGVVSGNKDGIEKQVGDVVFLGKPDVFFINRLAFPVVLDFKVNGWCAPRTTSPKPGYIRIRGFNPQGAHKDAFVAPYQGMMINKSSYLEDIDTEWAGQLSVYGWLCGAEVGQEFITGIDQLVCKPDGAYPLVRIAEHRLRVSEAFQRNYFIKAQYLWNNIQTEHIFKELSVEESKNKCLMLDEKANLIKEIEESNNPDDAMFKDITKANMY